MKTKTVTIGDIEIEVSPVEGTLVDGELAVSSFNASIKTDSYINFSSDVDWDDDEAIIEEIRALWMSSQEWPETDAEVWDSPWNISRDTNAWETMLLIIEQYPITNSEIDEEVSYDYSASAITSDLKDVNYIAVIGYDGDAGLIAPTHVGLKEIYHKGGLYEESGLNRLYENTVDKNNEDK